MQRSQDSSREAGSSERAFDYYSAMAPARDPEDPYASALDLPSTVEMLAQIRGMKSLTRFVGRSHRGAVLELEEQVRDLATTIDRFYELLGPRHWIFHESLNVRAVKSILGLSPDDAERRFIALYEDHDALRSMVGRLNRFPTLRSRMNLIEKARLDYEAGRFYATTLVLLTVMDGFVNDLEPARRRGLHTRQPDDMTAWDSVVGHHMGLARAQSTFTKSTSKTSDEPVTELYRNGLIHGTLINYDNPVVATKAWNRLFAVGDWAASREKREVEPESPANWGEVLSKIAANERTKRALEAWRPSRLSADDPGFDEAEACARAKTYLEAWARANYGAMASFLSPTLRTGGQGKAAGMIREECSTHVLRDFKMLTADFEAPVVCEIDVELTFEDQPRPARMRWIRETADGQPAVPEVEGEWFLYVWGPWSMLDRAA